MNRREFLKKIIITTAGIWLSTKTNSMSIFSKPLKKKSLSNNFTWGIASSAFQTEGAWNTDGKGESIWDRFSHRKFKNGENADNASLFYYKYQEDIQLLKSLNFNNFRFSLSWSRILPEGTGQVNQQGIDFYHRVIDSCLDNNIEPWITLYHWDLPQKLEEQGGWTNRDIIGWFSEYAEVCTNNFGDKIKNWLILNEPMSFTGLGYGIGYHAPAKRGLKNFLPAVHHAALCQAIGGRIVRDNIADANIGTTFSCAHVSPADHSVRNINAANRVNTLLNRLFIEPSLGMGYPVNDIPALKQIEKHVKSGDENLLPFDFDFIGLQYYYRVVARYSFLVPMIKARQIPAEKRNVPMNDMNLEVYPKGLYQILRKFSEYEKVKRIIVTENGVCYNDTVVDGKINDNQRIEFFRSHLKQIRKARKKGCPVDGYFVWSLTDNFEWAEGFQPRFGLIYIDYHTQQRYIKNSGYWWKEFLT